MAVEGTRQRAGTSQTGASACTSAERRCSSGTRRAATPGSRIRPAAGPDPSGGRTARSRRLPQDRALCGVRRAGTREQGAGGGADAGREESRSAHGRAGRAPPGPEVRIAPLVWIEERVAGLQRISAEVRQLRGLDLSLSRIAASLDVSDKTAAKALAWADERGDVAPILAPH
jgi:hypothetical protein